MKQVHRGLLLSVACAGLLGYLVFRLWSDTSPAPAPEPIPKLVSLPSQQQAPSPIVSAPKPAAETAITTTPAAKPPAPSPSASNAPRRGARLTVKAGEPIPELFPHQAERDELVRLASTYDSKNIPLIAPSLKHPDSTVREAARQALAQMGDAAAVPYLREALKNTRDSDERKLIQEIIEFLSLPRFMDAVASNADAPAPNP